MAKDVYYRKMDLLIEDINKYLKKEGYKEDNDNYEDDTPQKTTELNINVNNNDLNNVADYPPGPFPNFAF